MTESQGAERLRHKMEREGWMVNKTHGSLFMVGWPDYFVSHPLHGMKWIETKSPIGQLRAAQIERFTNWTQHGVPIYILRDEKDYHWLFEFPRGNWTQWLDRLTRP